MADSVSCVHLENYQCVVRAGEHAWVADIPQGKDGDNMGPNPFEQLLGALASCTVITMTHYAGQSGIAVNRVALEAQGEHEDDGYAVTLNIKVGGDLSDTDLKRLEKYAKSCSVHKVLGKAATIEIAIERL